MKTLLSLIGTISIIGSGTTNAALLTSQNNNPKVAKFDGHFPGLGPYGKEGDQDHAWAAKSTTIYAHIKFDLSRTSEQYINDHYLGRGETPWDAIYDFETEAYPSSGDSGFTYEFFNIMLLGNIDKMVKDLSDWIGYTDSHHDRLKLHPAYFEVTMKPTAWGDLHFHWRWGYNRPF